MFYSGLQFLTLIGEGFIRRFFCLTIEITFKGWVDGKVVQTVFPFRDFEHEIPLSAILKAELALNFDVRNPVECSVCC